MKIANDSKTMKLVAKELAHVYKSCFCHYSEETYVRGFAARHLRTMIDIAKSDTNIIISKQNQKIFIDTFTEYELKNIQEMRAQHQANEKKERKHNVKRKPQ